MRKIQISCSDGKGEAVAEAIKEIGITVLSSDGDNLKADIPEPLYDEVVALPGIVLVSEDVKFTDWND